MWKRWDRTSTNSKYNEPLDLNPVVIGVSIDGVHRPTLSNYLDSILL